MSTPLRVIPLGGLGEIGRNMMVYEYGDEMIIVDVGLMFPEEEMLGVDLVIPDITYVMEHPERVKGVFLTHGHEDHIGALPFLLPLLMQIGFGLTPFQSGLVTFASAAGAMGMKTLAASFKM